MSTYTTGELAKLCGVSVRTVQYYDTRGILVPSALSEGGRRLYSEQDLNKLKVICFLRNLDIPIESIRHLFAGDNPEQVIELLFEEQESRLRTELAQKQDRLEKVIHAKRTLRQISQISPESIGDIAHIMENKKRMDRIHWILLGVGIPLDLLEIGAIVLWVRTGNWRPFAIWAVFAVAVGYWMSQFYFRRVSYICPECHTIFRPRFWDAFFARHTPWTRKLTCCHCGYHGFCVETYGKDGNGC